MISHKILQYLLFLTFFIGFISCKNELNSKQYPKVVKADSNRKLNAEFQQILDSAGLKGAILVWDENENKFQSNDFNYASTYSLPASTFKIPNTLIGLQSGKVVDSTVFKWDGNRRFLKNWEKDFTIAEAYKASCLPCYQDLARMVGYEDMRRFVDSLHYGDMKFDDQNYDEFWVVGDSKINLFEQIDFLKRLYHEELPFDKNHMQKLKSIMILDTLSQGVVRGKTGWASHDDKEQNKGWFVGYIERNEAPLYFATRVQPSAEYDMKNFMKDRVELTKLALKTYRP